jgi:hypothetical protein
MDGDLYERDFYTWTQEQAAALRRLAEQRPNILAELDLPHLIEEVADLGSEQVHAVTGNLRQMLRHLMFIACQPSDTAVPHWRGEAIAMQANAASRYLPSMRQKVEPALAKDWQAARRSVVAKLGRSAEWLPLTCPFVLDVLLDEDAPLEALIDRLRPPEEDGA